MVRGRLTGMKKVLVQAAVVSHKGNTRKNNEDNFCLDGIRMRRQRMDEGAFIKRTRRRNVQLYAVCDGMGGTEGGETASSCAVSRLSRQKSFFRLLAQKEQLAAALTELSHAVCREGEKTGQKTGTTIALALLISGKLYAANIGDSRIYRLREGRFEQISTDHSRVARMVSLGLLTKEQAQKDPERHLITQYLGMPPEHPVSPYLREPEELMQGDMYLLCSDGLTDMVEEEEIGKILKAGADAGTCAAALLKAALENGGRDNITAMVLRVLA